MMGSTELLHTDHYDILLQTEQEPFTVTFLVSKNASDAVKSYPIAIDWIGCYADDSMPNISLRDIRTIGLGELDAFAEALDAAREAATVAYDYVHESVVLPAKPEHFDQEGRTEYIVARMHEAKEQGRDMPDVNDIIHDFDRMEQEAR